MFAAKGIYWWLYQLFGSRTHFQLDISGLMRTPDWLQAENESTDGVERTGDVCNNHRKFTTFNCQ